MNMGFVGLLCFLVAGLFDGQVSDIDLQTFSVPETEVEELIHAWTRSNDVCMAKYRTISGRSSSC